MAKLMYNVDMKVKIFCGAFEFKKIWDKDFFNYRI